MKQLCIALLCACVMPSAWASRSAVTFQIDTFLDRELERDPGAVKASAQLAEQLEMYIRNWQWARAVSLHESVLIVESLDSKRVFDTYGDIGQRLILDLPNPLTRDLEFAVILETFAENFAGNLIYVLPRFAGELYARYFLMPEERGDETLHDAAVSQGAINFIRDLLSHKMVFMDVPTRLAYQSELAAHVSNYERQRHAARKPLDCIMALDTVLN